MTFLVFGTAFSITALLTPLMIWLGPRLGIADAPGGRRQHHGLISRLGGVAIFAGFMAASLLTLARYRPPHGSSDQILLAGVIAGAFFAFVYGLLDDILDLPPKPQFAAQFATGIIAIIFTIFIEKITVPFFGVVIFPWFITYPLTIFWVMGMMNTINFLDGLDGLAAGVTAIAALLFAWHAYRLGQDRVYLFPLALAGATLGFLPFNFSPAKIFMGSTGSLTLGWALASLSILAPAKVATALLVLGIPIIDVAWLMLWRWRKKGSPLVAGRDHLHFRLLDMGFSTRAIVLGYYTFSLAFGLLAFIISSRIYKLIAIIVLVAITLFILWEAAKNPKTAD